MQYDLKTAKRIAYFGAKKMNGQNYTYRPDDVEGCYTVVNPDGKAYFVNPDKELAEAGFGPCTCDFCKENKICKHFYWLNWRLAEDAVDAMRADEWAREQAAADWARWESEVY